MNQKKERVWVQSSILMGIIGIHFFYSGSAYISQMYSLFDAVDPEMIDIIALRYNYFCQGLGIFVFAWILKRFAMKAIQRKQFFPPLILMAMFISLMLFLESATARLWTGFAFNFLFGYTSGMLFAYLATHIPKNHRAKVFGFGYAIGSVGTYLMSNFEGGQLLASHDAVYVYLAAIVVHILMIGLLDFKPSFTFDAKKPFSLSKRIFIFVGLLFTMALISEVSSYYKSAHIFSGAINLALMRVFYALSLILAGIIADKSRKLALWVCLVSLTFSFYLIYIFGQANLQFLAWSFSYSMLGFYTLYRIIAWIDYGEYSINYLSLAVIGLGIGRFGEAFSTYLRLGDMTIQFVLISVLFSLATALFIYYNHISYQSRSMTSVGQLTIHFEQKYQLSTREREIFVHLLTDKTNAEIGDALFITENTVKFHIKHILQKTQMKNRGELIRLYHSLAEEASNQVI